MGTLHHATKVVNPGRAFVTRMYSTAARLRKMHLITRLNISFWLGLLWWHTFLQAWNGFSILRHPTISHPEFWAQADAFGAWGCAPEVQIYLSTVKHGLIIAGKSFPIATP